MKLNDIGLFLDRDGTINVEVDFLTKPEEIQLIPGAARAIREANELGLKVCVISNQSGVARGLLTEAQLGLIHKRFRDLLAEQGANVDEILYCPHHPDVGVPPYRKVCTCRKPNTGMLRKAADEFGIDLKKSFVIGDRCSDIQAGEKAGCGTVLVLTGYGEFERADCEKVARVDFVASNLYEAWGYIRKRITSSIV